MDGTTAPENLTVAEAAARLRVDATTVYGLCKAGRLGCLRVGLGRGRVIIPAAELAAYLDRATARPVVGEFKHLRSRNRRSAAESSSTRRASGPASP